MNILKNIALGLFVIALYSCTEKNKVQYDNSLVEDTLHTATQRFWNNLSSLCGKTFQGHLVTNPETDPDVADKILLMNVRYCSEDTIKIPFIIGDDMSRTWIIRKVGGRLELKHDHRHKDGSEDKTNFYGGISTNAGRDTLQMFMADQATLEMLDFAAFNVWALELIPNIRLAYSLRRIGTDRYFKVEFDLTREVQQPPTPWGWTE
jgi:hypothetical protein